MVFISANVAIFNGQGVGRRCLVLVGCRCSGRIAGHFNLNGYAFQRTASIFHQRQATAQIPSGEHLTFRNFLRQGDFCILCILSSVLCPILISDDAIHNHQAVRLLAAVCGQRQRIARHRQGIDSILVFRNRVHVKLVRVTCPAVQFKLLVGKLWLDLNRCVFCELGSCHINKLRIHQCQRMLYLTRIRGTDLVQYDISIAALYRKLLVTSGLFRRQIAIIHIAVNIGNQGIIVDSHIQLRRTDNI